MGKVCVACGAGPALPKKPMNEPEDCPGCGVKDAVQEKKEEGKKESSS